MAVKYFIKYFDVIGVEHRLDIYDDTYTDTPIQVDGNIKLTYSETDDNLEAIRGQGLSVELEANKELTFDNLWSENQKTYRVVYKRDSIVLFNGWLNPEGFFESFVNTNWIVSFDCIDGLGFLQDLAFVEDETGFPITGKKKLIDIVSLALQRTGLFMNINTAIDIRYEGLSDTLDVLDNVYANTERYIEDDGETIMSCEDVLRDVLEPFGAVLTSFNNEWYIYKPNQLFNDSIVTFYNYTYLGVPSLTPTKTVDFSQILGSNSKGFYPHHCSANQSIRNVNSVSAYRINYKYGLAKSLLSNNILYTNNGVDYVDFTVYNPTYITVPDAGGYGAVIDFVESPTLPELVIFSDDISIVEGVKADITIKYNVDIVLDFSIRNFVYQITNTNGADVYYLKNDKTWVLGTPTFLYNGISYGRDDEINIEANPVPTDGNLRISFFTPTYESLTPTEAGTINLIEVSVNNLSETPLNLKGEFHTVQRLSKPSTKVEEVKEVATGDNVADVYEGTMYKTDNDTPTQFWNRKGIVETKPLLQIMGEETLRLNQLPCRVFSGDVFGYFKYLSVITINGLNGVFLPIKYNYDTKTNIINAEFKQFYGGELEDISYEKTFDYGNTVKPTIK